MLTDANTRATDSVGWTVSARWLGAAPHRLMFFAGATNLLIAMMWWAAWLARPYFVTLEQPPVYPGWLHAFVMQYQMLPSFIFGFLLTTFPKWTKQPELPRRQFVPVGLAIMSGQLATLAGALGSRTLILVGVALTVAGWTLALAALARIVWREQGTTWHARSCVGALLLGYAGLIGFAGFLLGVVPPAWVPVFNRLGSFGMLLLVFFTVAHRMFPFFAANTVAGYKPWRPMWLLAGVWIAVLVRLVLALPMVGAGRWLFLPDGALAVLASIACWRWWPRGAQPGLLRVLFLALAWLPIAMVLFTLDGIAFARSGLYQLGLAPAHALTIGFFGSALVAMVTRVSQGHSGRPLVMPRVAWFTFVVIQLVVIVRIGAELTTNPYRWFAVAAVGWLIAFVPWVVRLAVIYLTPRVDQQPG